MKLPKYIASAISDPLKFDLLVISKIRKGVKHDFAYTEALNECRKYVKNFNPRINAETQRQRYYLDRTEIEIPDDVIKAVTGGFDALMDVYYRQNCNRYDAYYKAERHVQKHFPRWKAAANYSSYAVNVTIQAKKLKK
jgi:hypothetical protein